MPTEIEDQLTTYFAWVEQSTGTTLHRPPDGAGADVSATVVDLRAGRHAAGGPRTRRVVIALLAAASVLAAWLIAANRSDVTPTVPVSPIDAPTSVETLASPSIASVTEVTESATPTTTVVTSSTTTSAEPVIDSIAFGESVMQGAFHRLTDNGVRVDAQESIQGKQMIEVVRRDLAEYGVPENAIVQTGTNGPVTQQQYDEIADLLVDVPHVVFLTVKAPMAWIDANNAIIEALPTHHPNVTVVDWATAGQEIDDHLSASDGRVHLNDGTAARFYTNLILSAIGKPTIPDP
ncbi:MAG: putative acyltransferase [Ilumatobacteraceae bacterium]|nr:putative acyltransferase [Ilumatobacteraceae bacterium]